MKAQLDPSAIRAWWSERDRVIRGRASAGETLTAIGRAYGISRQRVSIIVQNGKPKPRKPGRARRA